MLLLLLRNFSLLYGTGRDAAITTLYVVHMFNVYLWFLVGLIIIIIVFHLYIRC